MAKYRILSFDGGGILATTSITLLNRLANESAEVLQNTELFVGNSAGGVIALGLASGKMPQQIMHSTYFSVPTACSIFTDIQDPLALNRPMFFNRNKMERIQELFPENPRLKDLKRRVLIPSFEVIGPDGGRWRPVFYHNFPGSPTGNARVIDVALYTTAVPILFPSVHRHIDGAVFANNPSIAGISFAIDEKHGGKKLEDIALLSFGTGLQPYKISGDTREFGFKQWLDPRAEISMPLLTVFTDGEVQSNTHFSRQLLGLRFHRLNPPLGQIINGHEYDKIPYLRHLATQTQLGPTLAFIRHNWQPISSY